MRWYDPRQFLERKPDFVAINSLGKTKYNTDLFSMLQRSELPYEIVFERASPKQPRWVYPRGLTFVQNQQMIFARRTGQD